MLHFHGERAERYKKIIKVKLFVKAINNSKSETLRKISNDHAPLKKINEMYYETGSTLMRSIVLYLSLEFCTGRILWGIGWEWVVCLRHHGWEIGIFL